MPEMKAFRRLTKEEPCGLKLSFNQSAGLQSRKPERVLENTQGPCGGD